MSTEINAPHLWTRRTKIIEPRSEMILKPQLSGYWRMKVIRPDGRVRKDTGWFRNLITDVGLDLPGQQQSWLDQCVVGTGNAAPSVSDTALQAQVGATTTKTENVAGRNQTADRYAYWRTTWRFSAGEATGNLAEIGVFETGGTPDVLLSRALILDGTGTPTTITVLEDEALDCTYEIRNYPPLDDVVAELIIGATTHDIVLRPSEVDLYWNMGGGASSAGFLAGTCSRGATVFPSTSTIGAVTASPSGAGDAETSSANNTYVAGTHQREFSYTWGLTDGNVAGGIAAVQVNCGSVPTVGGEATSAMSYQFSVDPVIPKDATNNLTLNFRQSWARRSI